MAPARELASWMQLGRCRREYRCRKRGHGVNEWDVSLP